jgi:hypothetical protein
MSRSMSGELNYRVIHQGLAEPSEVRGRPKKAGIGKSDQMRMLLEYAEGTFRNG